MCLSHRHSGGTKREATAPKAHHESGEAGVAMLEAPKSKTDFRAEHAKESRAAAKPQSTTPPTAKAEPREAAKSVTPPAPKAKPAAEATADAKPAAPKPAAAKPAAPTPPAPKASSPAPSASRPPASSSRYVPPGRGREGSFYGQGNRYPRGGRPGQHNWRRPAAAPASEPPLPPPVRFNPAPVQPQQQAPKPAEKKIDCPAVRNVLQTAILVQRDYKPGSATEAQRKQWQEKVLTELSLFLFEKAPEAKDLSGNTKTLFIGKIRDALQKHLGKEVQLPSFIKG